MSEYISAELREELAMRANGRCEYCLIHEDDTMFPHEPDHIIARKHGGQAESSNLAWACFVCNRFKGSDIASIDSATDEIVPLFHPRHDDWTSHFQVASSGEIIGRTARGRVTVFLLRMNLAENVQARNIYYQMGRYPELGE